MYILSFISLCLTSTRINIIEKYFNYDPKYDNSTKVNQKYANRQFRIFTNILKVLRLTSSLQLFS